MGLTKAQLEALNDSSFPNNNAGVITPTILRNYNDEVILNTVNQDVYSTDSASFTTRINQAVNTGLVTTASFNAYTSSTNAFTASISTSVGSLQTFSGSEYKTDSASFSSRISTADNTGLVTTASFNAYTSSNDTKVNNLTAQTASYVTAQITGSSLVTASVSQSTITFTKGDGSQFNIVVADVSGSEGDFVTTSSFNAYTASQDFLNTTFATTSSVNSLSASIFSTDATQSSLINGKLDTSSFTTFSTSVDSRLDLLELSGSGFATTASVNALSASIYQTDSTQSNDITNNSSSFATSISASNFNITNNSASVAVTINNLSASIFQTDATQSNNISELSASNAFNHSRFATTGSNTFIGNQTINGDISASGNISASSLYATNATIINLTTIYETSSVIYSSGSNQFGDELSDVQILSGSVQVVGGLTVNGVSVSTQSVDISSLNAFTASQIVSNSYFATTGSNTFTGNQIITGSITTTQDITVSSVKFGFGNPAGTSSIAIGNSNTLQNNTGQSNVAIGINALNLNVTGNNSVAIGTNALQNALANNNTGIGADTLKNAKANSDSNTAIGQGALENHFDGDTHSGDNMAFGLDAMRYVTSGSANTAIGTAALRDVGRANENVFIGWISGINASGSVDQNVVIGGRAGQKLAGSSNTIIGHNAGANLINGGANTFIGQGAGNDIVTGSSNTLIGRSLVGVDNWNNVIAISDGAGAIKTKFQSNIWEFTGSVNIQNTLTASLQQGYVWVGDTNGRTITVATSSFGGGTIDTGSLVTTASFNAYTQSTNTFTASISTSVGLLQTFSGSEYKGDSSSFDSRINAAGGQPQVQDEGTILGNVSSFNFIGAGVTASVSSGTASVTITGGGSIDTSSLATTGSNTFVGNQIISGNVELSENSNLTVNNGGITKLENTWVKALITTSSVTIKAGGLVSSGSIVTTNDITALGSISASGNVIGANILTFATTGSNTFTGQQTISGSNLNFAVTGSISTNGVQFPNSKIYQNNFLNFEANNIGVDFVVAGTTSGTNLNFRNASPSGQIQFTADSGAVSITSNNSTVSLSGSAVNLNGVDFIPFSSSVNSRLLASTINTSSFATTGSNTFNGNQVINGSLQVSSSATYDLDITGAFQATAASRISGSNGIASISQVSVAVTSGSGANLISSIMARGYVAATSASNQIALYGGISSIGGFSSGKVGGGIAVSSGSAGLYYFPIEFQASTAYTDGRVTFNNPISASAGIVGDTSITGSVTISGSLNMRGSSTFTGSVSVASTFQLQLPSGSNQQTGIATLDGANPGAVTVSNSLVNANSIIMLTKQTNNHPNAGPVVVSSKGSGTFTITSNHNGDTDVVAFMIINPS